MRRRRIATTRHASTAAVLGGPLLTVAPFTVVVALFMPRWFDDLMNGLAIMAFMLWIIVAPILWLVSHRVVPLRIRIGMPLVVGAIASLASLPCRDLAPALLVFFIFAIAGWWIGGAAMLAWPARRTPGRCAACGYLIWRSPSMQCPECGARKERTGRPTAVEGDLDRSVVMPFVASLILAIGVLALGMMSQI